MEKRPTKKQKELLSFIDGFIKGNGYSPSYREIMRALDYKSVSTVASHVDGLIARGWLIKRDNEARTLEVVMPTDISAGKLVDKPTTEREIRAKIKELSRDSHANQLAIATLNDTLTILGYADKTELA